MNLCDKIPGYRDALEREAVVRESAFVQEYEWIDDIRVRPLTLRKITFLTQLQLPAVECFAMSSAEVAQFIWVVSEEFDSRSWFRRVAKRAQILTALFTTGAGKLFKGVEEYLNQSFQDAPGAKEITTGQPTCWIAQRVHRIAAQYGWTINEILNLPVKTVLQLEREMAIEFGGKPIFINPSDSVRTEYLQSLNGRN